MKKSIQKHAFGLLLAAGLTTSAFAQTKIYEFPFDNSYDASVGTGTFTESDSTSFTTDRHGNANSAIQINNKATAANNLILPLGNAPRSISLWVKLNQLDIAGLNILYAYGHNLLNQADMGVITPTEVWHSGYANEHKETLSHSANTWYHFVFTYDGSYSRIYRQGTLIGSSSRAWSTAPGSTTFILGCGITSSEAYFKGAIDDLQIYDYAISAAEVTGLYNQTSTVSINNIEQNNITAVYPNPANSIINVVATENTNISIVNVLGATIATQQLQTGDNTLDISTLTNGVYFIQTANGGTVKFIKE